MLEAIYSSEKHRSIVEVYINMCKEFTKDVSSDQKYKNYTDVLHTIIEYHNGYGAGVRENNFYDWLMIIPINLSVATSGFFAGLETKRNAAVIRAYKVVLDQMLHETVERIDTIEPTNE
jgi:hypothetical protein|tara:strand:+ start:180 stop:536 length:357 start_codon:yes stop_codon:yes gene_type:complete